MELCGGGSASGLVEFLQAKAMSGLGGDEIAYILNEVCKYETCENGFIEYIFRMINLLWLLDA